MKIIGMIGGIGPESTIDYYRRLLEGAQKRSPGGPALQIVINSIDLQKGLDLLGRNQLTELTAYIVPEVMRLHNAGVDFGFLAANSPHIVFGNIARRCRFRWSALLKPPARKPNANSSPTWAFLERALPCMGDSILMFLPVKAFTLACPPTTNRITFTINTSTS